MVFATCSTDSGIVCVLYDEIYTVWVDLIMIIMRYVLTILYDELRVIGITAYVMDFLRFKCSPSPG